MSRPRLAVFPKGFFDALVARRMPLPRWLDLAATLGVDGAEMYPRFLDGLDETAAARLKREAAARGLALPMMCHSPDFTLPDPAGRAAEVEHTRAVIAFTAAMGGTCCRVLSGQARPGLAPPQAHGWVVAAIEAVLPAARAAGVTLAIENHYKDGLWEYPEFAQSSARYLAILHAVPELKAQYDPSNAIVAGEDQYALLEAVLPRVATMHASDRRMEGGKLLHGVVGRGLNDYDRIFARLAAAGFTGWISIEDGEAPTEAEGMANLKASADFLRGKLAAHFGAGARA